MSQITVVQLAEQVNTPVEKLLSQLQQTGAKVTKADDLVSDADRSNLLAMLEGQSAEPKRITLKRKTTSEIKLTGSRGVAAKTVSVEVRKRRTYVKADGSDEEQQAQAAAAAEEVRKQSEQEIEVARRLAEEEMRRLAAEEDARRVAEARARAEEEARQFAEAQAKAEAEAAAAAAAAASAAQTKGAAETSTPITQPEPPKGPVSTRVAPTIISKPSFPAPGSNISPELEAMRRRAAENARRSALVKPPVARPAPAGRPTGPGGRPAPAGTAAARPSTTPRPGAPAPAGKGRGKDRDRPDRNKENEAGMLRGNKRRKGRSDDLVLDSAHGFTRPVEVIKREVEIGEYITVGELASRMTVKAAEVIKVLMKSGVMATINQNIDHDTAHLIVEEMGHIPKTAKNDDAESQLLEKIDIDRAEQEGEPRPPVVTIMGHVDHGKTSLLDYIRKTRVASGEAGGITQHIGAYHVETPRGVVTFLDTPGHAAFTKMRARGAKATDIVVLVCAADDSVMPQTREAIQHARAGNVPMVVAVTKCDKPDANPDRVRTDLSKENVISEDWGGDTQFVNVSAMTGEGIDKLLEAILLQAEVLELQAPVDGPAQGLVIESRLDKGRGPVATVLVKSGTLKSGDTILCGQHFGRVRALFDESGNSPKSVGPSLPVEVLGLSGVPDAGDDFMVLTDERKAREIAQLRESKRRESKLVAQQAARLDQILKGMGDEGAKALNLMVKTDVQGSAEAISEALLKLPSEEVRIRIVSSAIGGITESDVELALASKAIILAFNVRADATARRLIQESGLDVRYYSIIYDLLNDVKDAIGGLLGTETREQFVGYAKVRDVFSSSKFGQIAGCLVTEGFVAKSLPIRVLRDNVVIFEGALESLRRFKDDVSRVEAGTECGIGVKNYKDVKAGDLIEVFERIEVKRTVGDAA